MTTLLRAVLKKVNIQTSLILAFVVVDMTIFTFQVSSFIVFVFKMNKKKVVKF